MQFFFVFLFAFLLILISLFMISKTLTEDLGMLLYKVTRSQKAVVYILAFIYFPGTLIHEMSHLLTAAMLGVHVGEVELFPEITDKGIKLGSVQIAQTDIIRRSLIGTAPFIIGIILILTLFYIFPPDQILNASNWVKALVIYFLFEVSNTMYSSNKDMEGVMAFLVALISITFLCFFGGYVLLGESLITFYINFDYSFMINYLSKASQLLLIPLAIDLVILLLSRIMAALIKGL